MKSFTKTSLILLLFISSIASMTPMTTANGGWLDGWDYRKTITIIGSEGASTGYQVKITFDYYTGMDSGFDDVRFTAVDGETELDHWREFYVVSTNATFWVEVTANLNITQIIYMYFGNTEASSMTDGDATFEFFDNFNGLSLNMSKWTFMTDFGTEHVHEQGNLILIPSTDLVILVGDVAFGLGHALRARIYFKDVRYWGWNEKLTDNSTLEFFGDMASIEHFNEQTVSENEGVANEIAQTWTESTWQNTEIKMVNTTRSIFLVDDVVKQTHTTNVPDGIPNIWPAFYVRHDDTNPNLTMDWILVRNVIPVEPVALFEFWQEVGSAEFIFPVRWDPTTQFGYDMFFIALGLIMIPFSTLYLVRGGRKNMSRDKLFYGLIIFVMGLGLLIGGVMP